MLGKEPNLVELILEESAEVLRAERGVLIVETRHGFVCANAGIDSSNLPDPDTVCLLPEDPDASARSDPRGNHVGACWRTRVWGSADTTRCCPATPTPGSSPPSAS